MSWIKIESENDLPQIKGSCFCWVMMKGKVSMAVYQCRHFEVKAEYGLYPWNLITHYQPIEKPEPAQ